MTDFLSKPVIRDDIVTVRPHALAKPTDPVGLIETALWVMKAEGIPPAKTASLEEMIPPPDGAGRTWGLLHSFPGAYRRRAD